MDNNTDINESTNENINENINEASVNTETEATAESNVRTELPPPDKRPKGVLKSSALISLALMFTVFFFSPVEMFIANRKDFCVDLGDIAIPMLITAVFAVLVNMAVLGVLAAISKNLYKFVLNVQAGLLMAFYVQMIFLNGRMLNMSGDHAMYLDDTKLISNNIIINFVIFIIPLFIWALSVHYKENTALKAVEKSFVIYISALVFVMQLVGVIGIMAQKKDSIFKKEWDSYLSYEPLTSLSKDGNVIVFLTDRLDGVWLDQVISAYPELIDKFEGFTCYRNNISGYTNTFPSVPEMLTSEKYNGESWAEYLKKAWEKQSMSDDLKAAGYSVNYAISSQTTYRSLTDLENKCDNIGKLKGKVSIKYLGRDGVVSTMSNISAGKLVPYMFKPLFLCKYSGKFNGDFIDYDKLPDDYIMSAVSAKTDMRFYNYLCGKGLNTNADKKNFTFIHLFCAHDAQEDLSSLYEGYDKTQGKNYMTTMRGDFEILFKYFEQMKELGVYDNSTIIVLGDHGRPPYEIEFDNTYGLDSPIMTGLLIKPANAPREPLKPNDTAQLSNNDFAASVLDYAGIKTDKYGMSYREVYEGNIDRERDFHTYMWKGLGYVEKRAAYKVKGDARDFKNWKEIK